MRDASSTEAFVSEEEWGSIVFFVKKCDMGDMSLLGQPFCVRELIGYRDLEIEFLD